MSEDDDVSGKDAAELLRSNEALRRDISELRASHGSLTQELAAALLGNEVEKKSRRAALNLLEDAIAARRTAQREVEERRRVEGALKEANRHKDELLAKFSESEARRTLLLELTDRLRSLAASDEIMRTAAELLGRHLGAAETHYVLVEADGDSAEIVASYGNGRLSGLVAGSRFRISARAGRWASALQSGQELFSDDTRLDGLELQDESLTGARIRAASALPLLRDGRLVAVLTTSHAEPRTWTEADRRLVRAVAERTWAAAERARAEEALRVSLAVATAARAESDAANRAKDEFLAMVSHELRTPLASILLWAGAVRSGAVPIGDLSRALDAIGESAESLSLLIEDLLDLSRLESGKLALAPSIVDIARLTNTAIDMVKPMSDAKQISIEREIEQGLGPLSLDAGRVKQVLANLLTNATKFTPAGGRIVVRVRRAGTFLEVEVSDNGEGIAADFMPHVFEKFRQADMRETRQHMGLGIGLALTKQLVELHGGTVEASSEGLGKGATFRVRLPSRIAGPDAVEETAGAAQRAPMPLANLRILLVEDDVNTRDAMEQMLNQAGARVTTAGTVAEALAAELDGEAGSDIIVSDIGLPGAHGFELMERVAHECQRRGRRRPAACAVSAHARDSDRKRAIAAGFDIYVTKPVTREQLIEAVTDLRDLVQS